MQARKLQHTIEMVTHFAYLYPVLDVFTLPPHMYIVTPWPSQASLIRVFFFLFEFFFNLMESFWESVVVLSLDWFCLKFSRARSKIG